MIPLCFQTADPLSSQIAWPELHVAHDGPVRSWERQEENSGVEYNVPFHEESCRSSCIYSGPLHSCSFDTVQLASVHPRWCAVNPADLQQARIKSTQRPRSAISVSPHFLAGIFSVTRLSWENATGTHSVAEVHIHKPRRTVSIWCSLKYTSIAGLSGWWAHPGNHIGPKKLSQTAG